ncbi:unnamed protein product [Blumeria hordei]|uniref:Cyclin n=1 Tax=Blumeria hordei TaxID=2867405 RepID=A0A383V053_BLUHO|nr:unnamed protein product [Blumeria hordei]
MLPTCLTEDEIIHAVSTRPLDIPEVVNALAHVLPPSPNPHINLDYAKEPHAVHQINHQPPEKMDVFTISSITALKLLCAGIEALIKFSAETMLSDSPVNEANPNFCSVQAEEKVLRETSYKDLSNSASSPKRSKIPAALNFESIAIDGVKLRKALTKIPATTSQPYIIIGDNAKPIYIQQSAITRKFYSKHLPHISLVDYLMRIHRFCPISTAVYLATSCYIQKLVVEEKVMPITRLNCHRLVLAGLRVAMKALEDESYAHSRFSKVGGVSESELARLEISFCFLANFEFSTSEEALSEQAVSLKAISSLQGGMNFIYRTPLKCNQRPCLGIKEIAAETQTGRLKNKCLS